MAAMEAHAQQRKVVAVRVTERKAKRQRETAVKEARLEMFAQAAARKMFYNGTEWVRTEWVSTNFT